MADEHPTTLDDAFREAAEFLCSLYRHEVEDAVSRLSPSLLTSLGGPEAAAEKLRRWASPPDFPRLDSGISVGGDDDTELEPGGTCVVWLGVMNKRKRYPTMNRVRGFRLELVGDRWMIASDPTSAPYRERGPGRTQSGRDAMAPYTPK